ncbi:hypothetical protein Back2_14150 [Nocardioides baekrokdamisoli]|uniref:Glycosyl transferase n=1 Tax=Nocardioides baekrokdamisoli TaxID=1804624 RepID=A0A3G9J0G7_9ACTN|nr:hypothetical protein [Nocardioides baekrokdamisoli]BBH17128.1 hypothetical protein Back2_14150 [Nocardioides baekrokdamisoli]
MPPTTVETVPTAYFTILSSNYMPKAMSLAESLAAHHPGARLKVVLIDALSDDELPTIPSVDLLSTAFLGLGEAEVLRLTMIYELIEFATAIKPMVFRRLLEEAENAVYLDPDTFLTAPMLELGPDLAATAGGILLTPHFLEPVPADSGLSEGHLLHVGVYNLGFCAVDRRAVGFLDWWWGHLKNECLWDPMNGLFVDQKFCDIGSVLFKAGAWYHYGYNVSVANLHERPIEIDGDGFVMRTTGEPLRLFHFHAYDSKRPQELSTRYERTTAHMLSDEAVAEIVRRYGALVVKWEKELPPARPYPFTHDQAGKPLTRHLRRIYRQQALAGQEPPSPFRAEDAEAFAAWRKAAWKPIVKDVVGSSVKGARLVLPEEVAAFKKKFPKAARKVRSGVDSGGIWGH